MVYSRGVRRNIFGGTPSRTARLASLRASRTAAQQWSNRTRRSPPTTIQRRSRRRTVGGPNMRPRTNYTRIPRSLAQNIRGILDPHAPVKARHMDGAVAESQTHSNRSVNTVNIPQNQVGIILIQPDVITPVCYRPTALSLVTSVVNSLNDLNLDTTNMPAGPGGGYLIKNGDIDRWRVVSQGVKITLLNPTDSNDGYFECFRLNSTAPVAEQRLTDSVTPNVGYMEPEASWLGTLQNSSVSNTERPSYFAAALKDIAEYKFKLNPFAENHPFIHIPTNLEIDNTGTHTAGPPQYWQIGPLNSLHFQKVFDSLHDKTFDMIAIVVYGSSATGGSNLLIDSAQNLEVVYENDSSLARYHTPTIAHPAAAQAVHVNQSQNTSAASATTPSSGSSTGVTAMQVT